MITLGLISLSKLIHFFLEAAPWLCVAAIIATALIIILTDKTEKYKNTYLSEGMAIGMCFGTLLGCNSGKWALGIFAGMAAGLIIGMNKEKKQKAADAQQAEIPAERKN